MVSSSNQTKPVSASSSPNAAFEESFENDVTFQSLIDSNNDNDSATNFETLKSDGGDKQSPEDLNLFVRDLLDQMVRISFFVALQIVQYVHNHVVIVY